MIIRTVSDLVEDKLVKAGYHIFTSEFRGTIFAITRFDKNLPNAARIYVSIYPNSVDCNVQSMKGILTKGKFEAIDTSDKPEQIAEAIVNYVISLEKIYG